MPTKLILLWGMPDELMLVIEHPSGVRYQNQAGGYGCAQPELEGVLAPIEVDSAVKERIQRLEYPSRPGIPVETANAIDALLSTEPAARFLKVDRSRLLESQEAWVFVLIDATRKLTYDMPPKEGETYFGPLYGFGPCRGALTWINSD